MSLRIYTRIWDHSQAQLGELLVLLAIGDQARDCGFAAVSRPALIARSRLSERQVVRAVARLVAKREIAMMRGAGHHAPNVYRVLVGAPPEELAQEWCGEAGSAACHHCSRGVTKRHPRGDRMSPQNGARGDICDKGGVTSCHPPKESSAVKDSEAPVTDPSVKDSEDARQNFYTLVCGGPPSQKQRESIDPAYSRCLAAGMPVDLLDLAWRKARLPDEKPWRFLRRVARETEQLPGLCKRAKARYAAAAATKGA